MARSCRVWGGCSNKRFSNFNGVKIFENPQVYIHLHCLPFSETAKFYVKLAKGRQEAAPCGLPPLGWGLKAE